MTQVLRVTCRCGVRLRIPETAEGRAGRCPSCGLVFEIHSAAPTGLAVHTSPTSPTATCSICLGSIGAGDDVVGCTHCRLAFHDACWKENLGCATYGCSQVGILKPGADFSVGDLCDTPAAIDPPLDAQAARETQRPIAGLVMLNMAIAMALVSLVAFGVPSLVFQWIVSLSLSRRDVSAPLTYLIGMISAAGIFAGVIVSGYLWY